MPEDAATDPPTRPPPPLRTISVACLLAFVLFAGYAIARPATESLFMAAYSERALPQVWLIVAAVAMLVVGLYNRFARHTPLTRLLLACSAISALLLAGLLLAHRARLPGTTWALYVWKDVYIVVLVEIFWSYSNSLFPLRSARWIYGLFCACGALGGITGNLVVGQVAKIWLGTAGSLWLAVALITLYGALSLALPVIEPAQPSADRVAGDRAPTSVWREGRRVLRQSPYLLLLLIVIGTIQVVITLVDYEFHRLMLAAYPDTDARTAVTGQVYAAIDLGSFLVQLGTGAILRFVGVGRTLLILPALVAATVAAAAVAPRAATIVAAKIAGKVVDYSIFRAAKELLYLPLSYPERTQGKALVDMLTYRVAKGGASLLLQGLLAVGAATLAPTLALAGMGVWLVLSFPIVRRYRARTGST